ncbi:MAG TPA: hypothetical protein VE074_03895, partial [Jatrophihabitantaceae bacterium]|nr:hypothetical protein [Jatrophihabitantaceae bacterium]
MTNWTPSRRRVLGLGVATGALVATSSFVAPAGAAPPEAAPAEAVPRSRRGGPTMLDRTLLRGSPGAGGYRPIVTGPGEPHL